MNKKSIFSKRIIFLTLFFVIFYFPIFFLIISSFNFLEKDSQFFYWYILLFKDIKTLSSISVSLFIAVCTATMSVLLGTIASIGIFYFKRFYFSSIFTFMFTASLVVPDIITGLALLFLFITIGRIFSGEHGIFFIWISHTTFCISYVFVILQTKFYENNTFKQIEEAAMDLGATPIKSFFLIKIPMLFPSLASSWLLSFSLSLDDLIISSFVTRPGTTTLPMQIFAMVRRGMNPEVNAIATLILFCFSFIGFFMWKILKKKQKY